MLARSALTSSESEEKVDLVPTVIVSDKEPAQLELKETPIKQNEFRAEVLGAR